MPTKQATLYGKGTDTVVLEHLGRRHYFRHNSKMEIIVVLTSDGTEIEMFWVNEASKWLTQVLFYGNATITGPAPDDVLGRITIKGTLDWIRVKRKRDSIS